MALIQNGSLGQTISQLLIELQGLVLQGIIEGETIIQLLEQLNTLTVSATTVTITDIINLPPKEIELVEYIRGIQQPPIIRYQQRIVQLPPVTRLRVVNLNHWANQAYGMICGASTPNDFTKQECIDCVNQWMRDNPEVKPTKDKCNCTKQPKTKCQLEANACIQRKIKRMR